MTNAEEALKKLLGTDIDVGWVDCTASTNDDVKERLKESKRAQIVVRVANRQTKGRGTRGRVWENEEDALLMSVGLCVKSVKPEMMPFLGWHLMKLFQKIDCAVQVKWPNDLWINGKKLAGILCETVQTPTEQTGLVIGVGVNLKGKNPERAYLCLAGTNKISLCADMVQTIVRAVASFSAEELAELTFLWKEHDALYGKSVCVVDAAGNSIKGIEKGIDAQAHLLLEKEGQCISFSDVTVSGA